MIHRAYHWLEQGPSISLRQVLSMLILIFIFLSVLLGGFSYLYRQNKHRVSEIRSAVIQACRDSNAVRNEVRNVIQEVKNVNPQGLTVEETVQRYDRLTHAIAFLQDERCVPPRTGP